MSNTLGGAQPIFPVANLRASIDYYVNALGFQHDWGDAGFASVSRDRCHLFLCDNDQAIANGWESQPQGILHPFSRVSHKSSPYTLG
jgi:catechol 2,3-dioxygenase-like lactoylglutathione lyase family enzyme